MLANKTGAIHRLARTRKTATRRRVVVRPTLTCLCASVPLWQERCQGIALLRGPQVALLHQHKVQEVESILAIQQAGARPIVDDARE